MLRVTLSSRNNTIGRQLIEELQEVLQRHAADPQSRVLMLTGSGTKLFSPGFDVGRVASLERPEMGRLIDSFERLYIALLSHPKPTLAALNGHALAGGCIAASCCDFRVARRGIRIGMTAMNRSIAVPFSAQQILSNLLGFRQVREALLLGENYPAGQAREMGWIDQLTSREELEAALQSKAESLARVDPLAYRTSKGMLLHPLLQRIQPPDPRWREAFLDCWFSDAARNQLSAVIEGLGKRDSATDSGASRQAAKDAK